MRLAIDAMGGDNAPSEIVKGVVAAAQKIDDEIFLVGQEEVIREELKAYEGKNNLDKISIVDARDIIQGDDHPVQAVRRKKDSSMVKAVDMVKNGEADCVISAGNTGALMTAALLRIGRIKGIERPAIVTPLPNLEADGASLLLDCGANAECKPNHLMGFATMGNIYMKRAFGIENPRIGLINIGEEETKGTEMLKETYQMLKESKLNFVGNVEAREIPKGKADVLVCDGFTGNIVLKLTEGVAMSILKLFKSVIKSNPKTLIAGALIKGDMEDMKKKFDYASYGASPILGVKGLVFKMHGSSKADAVENALLRATAASEFNIIEEITNAVAAEQPAAAPEEENIEQ